ncbi:SDR family oxidoreductase [Solidesulfovibrio carbinolicus]|uniref:NAD(P)-dependent oxidoreductase n=1 Tax=Solidesulfovibrio carbinolicus TaxID=296842 RepID=A0A4P6HK35_9BACT|nr:SDR family oxidoreductase [Solidesulfovibrio carbinolicus]QAZ66200.1 NAD(P)-dependent oxidoreductase [Solidesulfovibrio carbinolicus]
MIAITGATGQLGRLVISILLESVPANELVAVVRTPDKAVDLAALGVQVRRGDYTLPDTLADALAGVDKLLLISSSEIGQRVAQHANAIAAAKSAGVQLLAYTSILHADSTPLGLGDEHRQTEALLAQSGLPFVLLRNGWYTENYAASIPAALQYGVLLGCASEGRIASAARADYGAAAAAVLLSQGQAGKIYELAGDASYTLSDFAAEIAKQSGKPVAYQDMPPADFAAALKHAGLPEGLADLLADSDAGASRGGLFDDSRTLSTLIGRPTTPMAEVIRKALAV